MIEDLTMWTIEQLQEEMKRCKRAYYSEEAKEREYDASFSSKMWNKSYKCAEELYKRGILSDTF